MNEITEAIIGGAIEVHRLLGPGLLESVYECCLAHELTLRGLAIERKKRLSISYKGIEMADAFETDLVVERKIVVELKAVRQLHEIHEAQLLTYLRLADLRLGLLINFNERLLKNGIRRRVNAYLPDPHIPRSTEDLP